MGGGGPPARRATHSLRVLCQPVLHAPVETVHRPQRAAASPPLTSAAARHGMLARATDVARLGPCAEKHQLERGAPEALGQEAPRGP